MPLEWLWVYLLVGLVLFLLGLSRMDETAWIGFRGVPEVFWHQLVTFVLFWPLLLAVEYHRR